MGPARRKHLTPSSSPCSRKSRLWGACRKPRKKKLTRAPGMSCQWSRTRRQGSVEQGSLSRDALALGPAQQTMPGSAPTPPSRSSVPWGGPLSSEPLLPHWKTQYMPQEKQHTLHPSRAHMRDNGQIQGVQLLFLFIALCSVIISGPENWGVFSDRKIHVWEAVSWGQPQPCYSHAPLLICGPQFP